MKKNKIQIQEIVFFGDFNWSLEFFKILKKNKSFSIKLLITSKKNSAFKTKKNQKEFKGVTFLKTNDMRSIYNYLIEKKINKIVSVAYSKIFPSFFFEKKEFKMINVHPSYLPQRRGADPIRNAILNDDKYFGITAHVLNRKIDNGPIISRHRLINDQKSNSWEILQNLGLHFFDNIIKNIFLYFNCEKKAFSVINTKIDKPITDKILTINKNDNLAKVQKKIRAAHPFRFVYVKFKNKIIKIHPSYKLKKSTGYIPFNLKDEIIFVRKNS